MVQEQTEAERREHLRQIRFHLINRFKNSFEWGIWPDDTPYFPAPNVPEPLLPKCVASKIRLLHWKFLGDPRFRFVGHPFNESVEFTQALECIKCFPRTRANVHINLRTAAPIIFPVMGSSQLIFCPSLFPTEDAKTRWPTPLHFAVRVSVLPQTPVIRVFKQHLPVAPLLAASDLPKMMRCQPLYPFTRFVPVNLVIHSDPFPN